MSDDWERGMSMRHNQSIKHESVVENLGPLYGRGREYSEAFTGDIAVETHEDKAALEQLYRLNFDPFYYSTQPGAPEDCGDERPATTIVEAMTKEVGPQNMGGTSTNALVWGMTQGVRGNHLIVMRGCNAAYIQNGVDSRPGGHTAEGAHGPNCGCAAIDLIAAVPSVITDKKRRPAMMNLTARLMGEEFFDEELFDINIARYENLNARINEYLPENFQHRVIELMRQLSPDINPINQRVGQHKGLAVLANRVRETRLNQDILFATPNDLKRPFEAFGVDVWHAFDLGDKLFTDTQAGREFVTGRIMYDSAALLAITNGSLALLEHKPRF
jgi:hypothetical protein